MENKSCIKASIVNMIYMMLSLLTALSTLSAGLYFYFDMAGAAGYGIGIAMFVVSALIFVMGELMYWFNCKKIKDVNEN